MITSAFQGASPACDPRIKNALFFILDDIQHLIRCPSTSLRFRRDGADYLNRRKANVMSKAILITGTSTGLGRDTAETLARSGHPRIRFYARCRRTQPSPCCIFARQKDRGCRTGRDRRCIYRSCCSFGASRRRTHRRSCEQCRHRRHGVSETFTTDQVRTFFDVNVFGVQRMLRAVLPTLRSQGEGIMVT